MILDLSNLKQAVESLGSALQIAKKNKEADVALWEVIRAGVIQNFEFTYELCWKFMKRWLENNLGSVYVDGLPRKELFRVAAENQLISRVENWFEYHRARNETAHTYDEKIAQDVFEAAQKFLADAQELLTNLDRKNV